ncbi:hypothetical protein [Streptomyces phaeochromogenes]|uniref:hypothetical protein n=1 Tax=Streptomyces phaeochromogenes TaxID=1923 RepID=UPI0038638BA7|nr:hypothetical protein OG277_24200 [Streptomyces phaeochromogenes]
MQGAHLRWKLGKPYRSHSHHSGPRPSHRSARGERFTDAAWPSSPSSLRTWEAPPAAIRSEDPHLKRPTFGLYDPAREHSACGVGFITRLDGAPSHDVIRKGDEALRAIPHRGGTSAEGVGDGGGVGRRAARDSRRAAHGSRRTGARTGVGGRRPTGATRRGVGGRRGGPA